MKPNVKLALSYVGYTCPALDELGKDYMSDLSLTKDQKETFLEFIEQIKKDITCPMRTALESACERIIKLEDSLDVPSI